MLTLLTEIFLLYYGAFTIAKYPAKERLSMLTMIPLTGKEPAIGTACRTAMEIVRDKVNTDSYILQDYHISYDIQDEAHNSNNAPSALINYLYPYLYNVDGQYKVNMVAKHLYVTQFSQFCAGPYLVRRDILPNLYRIQMPGEYSVVAIMLFVKNVGRWGQMGIFTYSLNINEYTMAKTLNQLATDNGIEVLHYHNEPNVNLESVELAKSKGVRIFALIYLQVAMCARFLCYSYMLGMRSPYYVFLPQIFCYFTIDSPDLVLPDGCTHEMLYEQMKTTYWIGVAPTNDGWLPDVVTSLGYTQDWFEREIKERLNHVPAADNDQRHLCHDTALAALVTLDKGDRKLRTDYNMSIKDFRTHPEFVARVVNQSAVDLDFVGLRIGTIRYSKKHEISRENLWVMQWSAGELKRLYRIPWEERDDMYNLSVYDIIEQKAPNWRTTSGNPPKDLSNVEHRIKNIPLEQVVIFSVIAGLGAFAKVYLLILDYSILLKSQQFTKLSRFVVDTLVVLGCLMLDTAAAYLLVGGYAFAINPNVFFCKFLNVLPVTGLSLLTTIILIRTVLVYNIAKKSPINDINVNASYRRTLYYKRTNIWTIPLKARNRFPNRKIIKSFPQRRESKNPSEGNLLIAEWEWNSIHKMTAIISGAILSLAFVFFTVWLSKDKSSFEVHRRTSSIFVNENDDTFYDETEFQCYSHVTYITFALLSIDWIILLISCFLAYKIGKGRFRPGVASFSLRIVSFNAATITTGSVIIGIALSSQFRVLLVTVACSFLVYANSAVAIWLMPVLKRTRCFKCK